MPKRPLLQDRWYIKKSRHVWKKIIENRDIALRWVDIKPNEVNQKWEIFTLALTYRFNNCNLFIYIYMNLDLILWITQYLCLTFFQVKGEK